MLHSWLNLQMWNHKYRGTADAEELVHIYIDIYTHTHICIYTYSLLICWLHWVLITRRGLSPADREGCFPLRCAGFSYHSTGLVAVAHRLSCPHGMWDFPWPRIKYVSPALAGRFLTTGPPRKFKELFLWRANHKFYVDFLVGGSASQFVQGSTVV